MRTIKLIFTALVGLGMTIYGILTGDVIWVAFGFPILLMSVCLL